MQIFIEILVAAAMGMTVAVLVARRPRWFWPILIIGSILGTGPRLFGYFFWDELIMGAVILGALVGGIPGDLFRSVNDRMVCFLIWIGYIFIESFIGIVVNNDIRIIRWSLYYLMLGILLLLINKEKRFPFPSRRTFVSLVLITTTFYYAGYILHGIVFEYWLGVPKLGRFMDQFMKEGFLWSGSAIAVFPTLLAMPVAVFAIREDSVGIRVLAVISIMLMMVTAFYYDSRISWVVIFFIFFVSIKKIGLTRVALMISIFGIVYMSYIPQPLQRLGEFFYGTFQSTQALWSPGESDVTRKLQFEASIHRLLDNPGTFMVGDGIYSHRYTILPHIQELHKLYLPVQKFLIPGHKETRDDTADDIKLFRTTAFSALLIDTGIIGIMLYTLNFIFMGLKVLRSRTSGTSIFLAVIFLAYMWHFNNNICDVVLLYLLIMPNGIIEQLINQEGKAAYS